MNNQAFSKIWIIGILVILVVGGVLVWQYFGGWKTYQNEEYGFKMEYPRNWYIEKTDNGKFIRFSSTPPGEYPDGYTLVIDISRNDLASSVEDWLDKMIGSGYFQSKEEIAIGAEKGYRVRVSSDNIKIFLYKGNKIFSISEGGPEGCGPILNCQNNIFNQMLSTFKFIKESETAIENFSYKTIVLKDAVQYLTTSKLEVNYIRTSGVIVGLENRDAGKVILLSDDANNYIFASVYPINMIYYRDVLSSVKEGDRIEIEGEALKSSTRGQFEDFLSLFNPKPQLPDEVAIVSITGEIHKEAVKDETADWQTYGNEEYGFEVKYPKNLNKEEMEVSLGETVSVVSWNFPSRVPYVSETIEINITDNLGGKSLRSILFFETESCKIEKEGSTFIKIDCNWGTTHSIYYAFAKNNKVYTISFTVGGLRDVSSVDISNELKIYNQMLSTFRFIEDVTADWKTYKNEDYGFEIKYPTDWQHWSEPLAEGFSKKFVKDSNEFGCSFWVSMIAQNAYDEYLSTTIKQTKENGWQSIEMTVNEYPAIKLVHPEVLIVADYFFRNNKGGYSFKLSHNTTKYIINEEGYKVGMGSIYDQECMDIFNQMLPTFRFIEVTKQAEEISNGEYPSWVKELIAKEEGGPVANPPASLTRCEYKNQIVYYLPPRCCDFPSVLYNENGNVICAPDGGFTGKGDGRCPDFFEVRKNCMVIWEDSR